jgi:hypothetical protein
MKCLRSGPTVGLGHRQKVREVKKAELTKVS